MRGSIENFFPQEADDEDEDDIEVIDIPDNISHIKTIADEQSPVMCLYYKQSDTRYADLLIFLNSQLDST